MSGRSGFTGIVLTGGRSTRMGTDKLRLAVDGRPLAAHAVGALRDAGAAEVLGVGGEPSWVASLGAVPVADTDPGAGPLPAVLAGLARCASPLAVLVAGDTASVTDAHVRALVRAAAPGRWVGVLAEVDGVGQPLLACYDVHAAAPLLARARRRGEDSLRGVLGRVPTCRVALPAPVPVDLDSPADVRSYAAGHRRTTTRGAQVQVPEIDVEELDRRMADGAFVLDVRQPDEYEEVRVPGAVLVPLAEVPDRVAEIPSAGPVLVVCRSGGRSLKAAEFLRAQGIDAHNVAGGTLAWVEAGKPTAAGPATG